MKLQTLIIVIFLLGLNLTTYSQEFNKNIDKDSLYQLILKDIPEEFRDEFIRTYQEGNEESKEFLLFILSMPRSSKKELIENYEKHFVEIEKLRIKYSKLVPDSLIVFIEFTPENNIISTPESIDLNIYRRGTNGRSSLIQQEWNLRKNSEKLSEMLHIIGWTEETLTKIKELLDSANCVSIENGNITSIGFARSGLGKYYYSVFNHNLSINEIDKYNNGCTYIFYKDHIVLEYSGGAVGPQCFPDE